MTQQHATKSILLALVFGAVSGSLLNLLAIAPLNDFLVHNLFEVLGQIFIQALKMLVVPLVFVSLVCGVTALKDVSKLGRLGGKAIIFYLATTLIAITLALSLAVFMAPGVGFQGENQDLPAFTTPQAAPTLAQTLIDLVPNNPFAAMTQGDMIPVIVFSLLLGVAILMAGESGRRIEQQFNDYNDVMMMMVHIVMKFAPVGVFCLIAKTFALQGIDIFKPLLGYFTGVVIVLIAQLFIVYPLLIRFLAGLNPWLFLKKMRQVQVFALSTASSNATLPVNIDNAETRLGVHNAIASFTLPLGATINMDGTAIMQGVAAVFIANVYGIDLTLINYVMIILLVVLASIGTAGVPGVGLVILAMVLEREGLPVEGIALIMGIDRPLDMMRTAVNVTGDASASVIIAKSEGQLTQATYDAA
jgi:DAACS family dicarboxylate/amino acid:cation (Na+ or H+) symporter